MLMLVFQDNKRHRRHQLSIHIGYKSKLPITISPLINGLSFQEEP